LPPSCQIGTFFACLLSHVLSPSNLLIYPEELVTRGTRPRGPGAHWASVFSNKDFVEGFASKFRPLLMTQEVKLLQAAPWGPHP
jgi:hypothetical protein